MSEKRMFYNNQLLNNLEIFGCENDQLTSLPELPSSLKELWCNGNQLTNLPELPSSLKDLECSNNKLKKLPKVGKNLKYIEIDFKLLGKVHKIDGLEDYDNFYNRYKSMVFILKKVKVHYFFKRHITENY